MSPLPTLDDLERDNPYKKPDVSAAEQQTKGRKRTGDLVQELASRDGKLIEGDLKELWGVLEKEAQNPEKKNKIINELMSQVMKKVPVQSALEAIKKLLKDKIEVREMAALLNHPAFLGTKNTNQDATAVSGQAEDSDDMLSTLLMSGLFNQPNNTAGNINEQNNLMLLTQLLGNKSGKGLNPVVMLSVLKLLSTQNQGQNQMDSSAIKEFINEIKSIYTQQENQKPAIDPMMLYLIKSSERKPDNNAENMIRMLEMINNSTSQQIQTIAQLLGEKFERLAENVAGSQIDPNQQMMQNFQFFREIAGDQRERSKDELDFELRKTEMELKKQDRDEILARQERAELREDQKSERILGLVDNITGKVLGEGMKGLMETAFKGRRKKKDKGFDASELGGYSPDDFDNLD